MHTDRVVFEFGRIQSPADALLYGSAAIVFAAASWFLYRRDCRDRPIWAKRALVSLRLATLAAAFVILLDPRLRVESTITRPSKALVLFDRSLSMTVADVKSFDSEAAVSRRQALFDRLAKSQFFSELQKTHEVAVYGFGRELTSAAVLQRVDAKPSDAAEPDWDALLPADQDQTRLGDSTAEVLRQTSTEARTALIVLSDGRSNAGASIDEAVDLAKRAKLPIHAVAVGGEDRPSNLRIAKLRSPARAFKGDPIRIDAEIQSFGVGVVDVPVELTIEPRDGGESQKIESKNVRTAADGSPVRIEFSYAPMKTGQQRLRLKSPTLPKELRPDDNAVSAGLEVVDQRTKVLLIASGPAREYRFLKNQLFRDRSMELTVLLQSARDGVSQEAQKMLIEFPTRREELFAYDVIVAVDADWSRLTAEQRGLLRDFVAAQAGGLLTFAGPIHTPALARGESLDAVTELYPVHLREVFTSDLETSVNAEPWPIALSPEGESCDFLRLDDRPADSRQRWKKFTGFFWCYPVSGVKPGATILARYMDPRIQVGGAATPAIVSQFVGSGRVLYIGSSELWRLRRIGEKYYERLATQLVRHVGQGRLLRGDGRGSLVLESEDAALGSSIPIEARLQGADFKPLLAESVPLLVVDPAGKRSEIALTAAVGRPGWFLGSLPARTVGELRLQLVVPGQTAPLERRLVVRADDLEMNDPRADRLLLSKLAQDSEGKLWPLDQISQIPPILEDKTEVSIISGATTPLWDKAWVMLALIALLSAEWLLRKLAYLA